MKSLPGFTLLAACWFALAVYAQAEAAENWVVYQGQSGPGQGRHIVLVSGDEEYRSEEALPMLAKILALRHGFTCTVLFAIDAQTGQINPDHQTNIPGLHLLEAADMMVLFTRFRELPDEQMKYIVDFTNSGKPVMGLRTATHPFRYTRNKQSPYARYSWDSKQGGFEGGYGRVVFGETWVRHHGVHGKESTRGLLNGLMQNHPILRGVADIWGPTDVYAIGDIQGGGQVLVWGQSLQGMQPQAAPNLERSLMPVAWIKNYRGEKGKTPRILLTTMGASVDLESEGLRRLLVNGCYWALGLEDQIPEKSNVDYVGEYRPTFFGFGAYQKGLTPEDFKLP